MDLHDELGPAILRGSTSPSRASRLSALRASVAGAAGGGGGGGSRSEPGVGQHSSEPGAAAAAGDLGRREGACADVPHHPKQRMAQPSWLFC
jgi:hypothetical protein